jgi:hypothetical protein
MIGLSTREIDTVAARYGLRFDASDPARRAGALNVTSLGGGAKLVRVEGHHIGEYRVTGGGNYAATGRTGNCGRRLPTEADALVWILDAWDRAGRW